MPPDMGGVNDALWFLQNPERRYRLRPCVSGELFGRVTYRTPIAYALIHRDFFDDLDRWLIEGTETGRDCEKMSLVMAPLDYDALLGCLWEALSGSAKVRWACDELDSGWLHRYRRERGLK
jgi:hypothetical protein